jgi:hypothetical protein
MNGCDPPFVHCMVEGLVKKQEIYSRSLRFSQGEKAESAL